MGSSREGRWGSGWWSWIWLVGLVSGCAPQTPAERVLATYQDGEVTESEYRSWLTASNVEHDVARFEEVLTSVALYETLAEAARQRGAHDRPGVALALADIEDRALEQALGRQVGQSIEVTEAAIDDWLAANGSRLDRPRRVRLSNIFKRSEGADRAVMRARMEAIRRQLVDGADWAATALRESDSQTRFRRGSIGLVKPGMLDPAVEKVAFALDLGEISAVIETEDGWTLLRCDGIKEAVRPTDAEKRAQATRKVKDQGWRTAWRDLEVALLAPVQLDVAAAQRVSTGSDTVVARVEDGWEMTLAEARALLARNGVQQRLPDVPEARVAQLLEALATRRQAAARARSMGLDQEAKPKAEVRWQQVLFLTANELAYRVEQHFVPLRDDEIRAYFEANQDQYQRSETVQLAAISWHAEQGELRERYRFGEQLVDDVRRGRIDFETAAERHSELPSSRRGGRMGWLDRQQAAALGPHVFRSIQELAVGEISLVRQPDSLPSSGSAFWIVKVLERRAARPLRFEEARKKAENALGNARTKALQSKLEQEVVASLNLEVVAPLDTLTEP